MVKVISVLALATLVPYYVAALYIPEGHKPFGGADYEAPIHTSDNAKMLENQYIVVFHPHADDGDIAADLAFDSLLRFLTE